MPPRTDSATSVLFVDDEPAILEGIRHGLRRHPFEVVIAHTVEEALEILAHASIQIVVSDERMPGMQGSEFLGIVCRQYPETIRIILSGQSTLDSAIRAVNEGEIFRFLLKPCHPTDLAQTLTAASQFWQLRHQASRLLAETRQRGQLLRNLEAANPGITGVHRNEAGVIEPEADSVQDLASLLLEMEQEITRTHGIQDDTRRTA